jgi:hypothetical protein
MECFLARSGPKGRCFKPMLLRLRLSLFAAELGQ